MYAKVINRNHVVYGSGEGYKELIEEPEPIVSTGYITSPYWEEEDEYIVKRWELIQSVAIKPTEEDVLKSVILYNIMTGKLDNPAIIEEK